MIAQVRQTHTQDVSDGIELPRGRGGNHGRNLSSKKNGELFSFLCGILTKSLLARKFPLEDIHDPLFHIYHTMNNDSDYLLVAAKVSLDH